MVGSSAAAVVLLSLMAVSPQTEEQLSVQQQQKEQAVAATETPSNREWRWSGSVRSRVEVWDWFNPAELASRVDDRYAFLGGFIRLSVAKAFGPAELIVEGSIPVLLGLPENSSLPSPQGQLGHGASYRDANGGRVAFAFVRQAYVRFAKFPDEKSVVKLGRFEFLEGHEGLGQDPTLDWIKRERVAQRLIAHFAFTHVQRTTEGVELAHGSGVWHVLAAAGRPTEGVFKLDANRAVPHVLFTYAGVTRATRTQDFRLFHIFYRDNRGATKVDARPPTARVVDGEPIEVSTAGAHLARRLGRVDVLVYGAMQVGRWGVQSHRAGAWVAEAGYQPALRGQPWFRGGLNQGSGDHDALDDRHGTFFQIMPTARIYARFPFFNMMNTEDAFFQAILRPSSRLTLRADYHHLRLSAASDLWYAGGGVFESRSFGFAGRPSSGHRNLAALVDFQADFRPDQRTVLSLLHWSRARRRSGSAHLSGGR